MLESDPVYVVRLPDDSKKISGCTNCFDVTFYSVFFSLRIKNKVFPPVPKPVIPEFSPCQPENQVRGGVYLINDILI